MYARMIQRVVLVAMLLLAAVGSAMAQGTLGREGEKDRSTIFTKIGGKRLTDSVLVELPFSNSNYPLMEQAFPPGGYTILAAHFLSTMLCDCTGGLKIDSTGAVPIPPGFSHIGLVGNIRVGGMGYGSATTQDSCWAGIFAFRYQFSGSGSVDTLASATWARPSRSVNDTIGSLGNTTNRLSANPSEAWDSARQVLIYNNGSDGAVGGATPGIQINRRVIFECSIGADRIYTGNFSMAIQHIASLLDGANQTVVLGNPPTGANVMAAGSGFPFSFDFDLVVWR